MCECVCVGVSMSQPTCTCIYTCTYIYVYTHFYVSISPQLVPTATGGGGREGDVNWTPECSHSCVSHTPLSLPD